MLHDDLYLIYYLNFSCAHQPKDLVISLSNLLTNEDKNSYLETSLSSVPLGCMEIEFSEWKLSLSY
jgi:hypothetical protein